MRCNCASGTCEVTLCEAKIRASALAFLVLGSTPVSGVGESVSLSRTSPRLFRRDAETHARDGRAPQKARSIGGPIPNGRRAFRLAPTAVRRSPDFLLPHRAIHLRKARRRAPRVVRRFGIAWAPSPLSAGNRHGSRDHEAPVCAAKRSLGAPPSR